MTGTLLRNININTSFNEDIHGNVYLLPKWERVKSLSCSKTVFFFIHKHFNEYLYKKFSFKNRVEKYVVKDEKGNVNARMDLKVYKDNVYIIDMDVNSGDFNRSSVILLQAAAEKAMYNTTDKKVYINLSLPFHLKAKVKNIIKKCGYVAASQREYEKEILGEEFVLDLKNPSNLNVMLKNYRNYLNKG